MFNEEFIKKLNEINNTCSKDESEKLFKYMNILLEWNEKMNLTAITDESEIISKHFVDSLTILKYIKNNDKVIDVGTGAGFPGIPLAIFKNNTKFTLLDSINKRINFLNEVKEKIELDNVENLHGRAEDFGQNKAYREQYDVAASRAVAPMHVLLEYLLPFVKVGGMCICMKGPNVSEEIKDIENVAKKLGAQLVETENLKLLNGEEVELPEFDFKVGTKRYNGNKVKMAEDEVLVIEGIHCLNDKLTEKIPQEQKYKIYISALTVLNMDSFNRISTTDTRLVRRIVRDNQFRGYTAQNTIATWDNVNKGEEKNIFPFQEEADSIFNTSLIYELGVLRNEAIPLLEKITKDEKEYAEAQRLIEILRYFEPISKDIVPSHSLLKEFLGGGDFKG